MIIEYSIPPKPTIYRGQTFRSRLEARWASYFDALGIEWTYEPECYRLPDGVSYLPDFRLKQRRYRCDYSDVYGETANFGSEYDDTE